MQYHQYENGPAAGYIGYVTMPNGDTLFIPDGDGQAYLHHADAA